MTNPIRHVLSLLESDCNGRGDFRVRLLALVVISLSIAIQAGKAIGHLVSGDFMGAIIEGLWAAMPMPLAFPVIPTPTFVRLMVWIARPRPWMRPIFMGVLTFALFGGVPHLIDVYRPASAWEYAPAAMLAMVAVVGDAADLRRERREAMEVDRP